jgi:hypothetical protein
VESTGVIGVLLLMLIAGVQGIRGGLHGLRGRPLGLRGMQGQQATASGCAARVLGAFVLLVGLALTGSVAWIVVQGVRGGG